jgi:hypothetical protein
MNTTTIRRAAWKATAFATLALGLGASWPAAGADGVSDGGSPEAATVQQPAPEPSSGDTTSGVAGGVEPSPGLNDGSSGSVDTPDGFNPLPDQKQASVAGDPAQPAAADSSGAADGPACSPA